MAAAIDVMHLTKRYGTARGCEDVSFAVEAGSVFGVLGPNGAGKSTIIRTLLDFQRPTSGEAKLLGLDSRRDSVAIHRRTGYLPGDLVLFEQLSGRNHLRLFGRPRGGVSAAMVDDLVERFEIELDRPVRDLSKGNRQKIGLLLAFAHEPELVVLDEPTSGLDPLMQEQFHQLLRELVGEGRTVLLSSHVLDEVQRVADRVTVIREGRVVVTDTIAALQAQVPRRVTLTFEERVDPGALLRTGRRRRGRVDRPSGRPEGARPGRSGREGGRRAHDQRGAGGAGRPRGAVLALLRGADDAG